MLTLLADPRNRDLLIIGLACVVALAVAAIWLVDRRRDVYDEARHWIPNAPNRRSFARRNVVNLDAHRRRELRGASLEYPERKAR